MILYLSRDQLLAIHAAQLARFGGARGVPDVGALESAVARPAMTFAGEDLYPDLAAKAAALMHSIIMNHPFADGNKRVGIMAAELFIELNDARLLAGDDELVELTLAVARGELDAERVAIWLRQRMEKPE